jgi:hypothetical protein
MPGTITVHNSVAADITVKLSGSSTGGNTSGKCHGGGNVTLDLTKMTGWQDGATISLSVHADGGVTRHNNAGQYHRPIASASAISRLRPRSLQTFPSGWRTGYSYRAMRWQPTSRQPNGHSVRMSITGGSLNFTRLSQ